MPILACNPICSSRRFPRFLSSFHLFFRSLCSVRFHYIWDTLLHLFKLFHNVKVVWLLMCIGSHFNRSIDKGPGAGAPRSVPRGCLFLFFIRCCRCCHQKSFRFIDFGQCLLLYDSVARLPSGVLIRFVLIVNLLKHRTFHTNTKNVMCQLEADVLLTCHQSWPPEELQEWEFTNL